MSASLNFKKAISYFQKSNFSRCLKICKKILGINPNFLDAYILGAQASLALGQNKQTEKLLLKAAEIQPENAIVHRNLGIFFSQMQRQKDADLAFQKSLELGPKDVQTHYCYAVHLDGSHRPKEASERFLAASEISPENPDIWTGLARAQRSLGQFDAARESCLTALEFTPDHLPALNNLGALSTEMEDYISAIGYLERSIKLNPKQPRAWFNLGTTYQRAERLEEAIEAYQNALQNQPDSAEILQALGRTFQKQESHQKAIEIFSKASEIAPDNPQVSYYLACGHIGAGNISEARTVCNRFLERHPADATALSCLALIASEHGSEEENKQFNCFDSIIQTVKVPTPDIFADEQSFIKTLANHILSNPTLSDTGQDHATRNGLHTGSLSQSGMGPLSHLEDTIASSLDAYVAFLNQTKSNEYLVSNRPKNWFLDIWGVAMNNQGHQIAHYHPQSWVSGCFYAQLPPVVSEENNSQEGWIEFGSPPEDFFSIGGYKVKAFKPLVGSMFLFPGYLTHRTIPFTSDEVRISIAFDIVPK